LLSRLSRAGGRTPWGWDLLESLDPKRCAVCVLALRSVDRFFGGLSYESTNDPEVRQRFVDGGGFCRDHAWRYAEVTNDGLSVALLERHLLTVALRQGGIEVGHGCMACAQRAAAEHDLARILADELRRVDFRRAIGGAALCARHAGQAAAELRGAAEREIVGACSARAAASLHAGADGLGGPLTGSLPARLGPPAATGERADRCAVCEALLEANTEPAAQAVCNPHTWDRLARGEPAAAGGGPCADCRLELALASAHAAGKRCLNHARGDNWRGQAAWLPELLALLDAYLAKQDYRRLAEPDGPERTAPWQALYWTVGLTRRTTADRVLPRFGLRPGT